jgi:ribosomal protein S1
MVHISNLAWERVNKVSDVLNVGDKVKVKVMGVDKEKGRIELSRKELLDKPGDYDENKFNNFRNGNRNYRGHTTHNDPGQPRGGFRKRF